MKEEVIKFLAGKEGSDQQRFNKAMELYRRSEGNNSGIVRHMNASGFSKDRLESLVYELKKLHSISDVEILKYGKKPVKKLEVKDPEAVSVNADDLTKADDASTTEGTEKASEATVEASEENPEKTEDSEAEATSDDAEATEDNVSEAAQEEVDEAAEEVEELMQELQDFDVEKTKYNGLKSFAARLTPVIELEPENQKGDTLKAFIEEAKKKYAKS